MAHTLKFAYSLQIRHRKYNSRPRCSD